MKINRVWASFVEGCSILEIVVDNYKVTFSMKASIVDNSSGQRQLFEFRPLSGYRPHHVRGMPFKELVIGQGNCRLVVDLNDEVEYSLSNVVYIDLNGVFRWAVVGSLGSCEAQVNVKKELLNVNSEKVEGNNMENLKIRIKYFDPELKHVEKISVGDWIDLRCAQDITLKAGEHKYIPLGVAMELPDGYEAWLTTRSSTAKKFGIYHCDDLGVIDGSYCGDNDEWKLPAIALRDTTIYKNDRIAQFRIHKVMPTVEFEEVESLGNPNRGGLGSTGKQ